jgi:curved DNA-binding protein CbpA
VKNLYELLEISPVASDEVIKAAYRVLSSRYHPDKNLGTESATHAMSAINRAYAILSDPARRKAYDSLLAAYVTKRREKRFRQPAFEPVLEPASPPSSSPPLKRVAALPNERSYASLALYLSVIIVVLFAVMLFHEMSPSGPAGETALNLFKEAPDPYLLHMNRGEALLSGNGGTQNYLEAKAEFEAVANAKDLFDGNGYRGRAAQKLGDIYATGAGVQKDLAKALDWYRRAAEYGRVVGPAPAFAAARILDQGINGKQDLVEAYRWYNVAAGTQFDIDKATVSRETFNKIVNQARQRREELGRHLTLDQLNVAQLSPLPPCRSVHC